MSKTTGVISMGVKTPIIKQGDDLKNIVIESVSKALSENGMTIKDGDVIGITESVVARADGNYVTIDDIVESIREVTNGKKDIVLVEPIMSRNRFAMILKAFARYADNVTIIHSDEFDQQGNPIWKSNPFTGVDIDKYYEQICEQEGATYNHTTEEELNEMLFSWKGNSNRFIIDARCHPISFNVPTLASFMTYPITRNDGTKSGYNKDWGLLGSNKADEEIYWAESLEDAKRKELRYYNCDELPEGKWFRFRDYYGMSSKRAQLQISDDKTKLKTSEGIDKPVEVKYPVTKWVDNMQSYLRSCMTYTNSHTIKELRENAQVIILGGSGDAAYRK